MKKNKKKNLYILTIIYIELYEIFWLAKLYDHGVEYQMLTVLTVFVLWEV